MGGGSVYIGIRRHCPYCDDSPRRSRARSAWLTECFPYQSPASRSWPWRPAARRRVCVSQAQQQEVGVGPFTAAWVCGDLTLQGHKAVKPVQPVILGSTSRVTVDVLSFSEAEPLYCNQQRKEFGMQIHTGPPVHHHRLLGKWYFDRHLRCLAG